MSRSPLSYPLNRGIDTDAGGAGDLQTDVMRFMAIIGLCLVAIFALVQSLPAPAPRSQQPEPLAPDANRPQAAIPASVTAAPEPAPPPPVEKPQPQPKPAAPPARLRLPPATPYSEPDVPAAEPLAQRRPASPAAPTPAGARPVPAIDKPAAVGFTLRFESDLALTRLVARDEIGLFAIRPGQTLRMSASRGNVSFWPASSPVQFHEMDESTVPASVIAALRRAGTASDVKWGVTLPARLTRDLDRYLSEHSGGSLVIGANGNLRLEH